jgi:hypothetical protein
VTPERAKLIRELWRQYRDYGLYWIDSVGAFRLALREPENLEDLLRKSMDGKVEVEVVTYRRTWYPGPIGRGHRRPWQIDCEGVVVDSGD